MLILADMAVERHADDLGQALAHLERPGAVAAERRHFQVAHEAGMVGHEIDPLRDRKIHQAADVALDELGADNAHRPDIRPGVELRDGMAAQQRREFVHHPDARAAGVDIARHALADADAVRIGEAQRPVGVDVDIEPSGG